jgi:hypothetical protein
MICLAVVVVVEGGYNRKRKNKTHNIYHDRENYAVHCLPSFHIYILLLFKARHHD